MKFLIQNIWAFVILLTLMIFLIWVGLLDKFQIAEYSLKYPILGQLSKNAISLISPIVLFSAFLVAFKSLYNNTRANEKSNVSRRIDSLKKEILDIEYQNEVHSSKGLSHVVTKHGYDAILTYIKSVESLVNSKDSNKLIVFQNFQESPTLTMIISAINSIPEIEEDIWESKYLTNKEKDRYFNVLSQIRNNLKILVRRLARSAEKLHIESRGVGQSYGEFNLRVSSLKRFINTIERADQYHVESRLKSGAFRERFFITTLSAFAKYLRPLFDSMNRNSFDMVLSTYNEIDIDSFLSFYSARVDLEHLNQRIDFQLKEMKGVLKYEGAISHKSAYTLHSLIYFNESLPINFDLKVYVEEETGKVFGCTYESQGPNLKGEIFIIDSTPKEFKKLYKDLRKWMKGIDKKQLFEAL